MGDINPSPVTTEPSIPPSLRAKIEAVHNSTSGHFGVEYTRMVLLSRGVSDDGLRRHVAKFVRDCPVCQLRSAVNRQIKAHRFTTASYTPMEVLNIDTIGLVAGDSADNCYMHVVPVNSCVLYRPPDNSRHKMHMLKAGPYIVVSVLGDKYSIQDLLTHKVVDTHASCVLHRRAHSSPQ